MVLRGCRVYGRGDEDGDEGDEEDGEHHQLDNVGGEWDKIGWREGINTPLFSGFLSFFLHTSLTGRLGY